MFDDGIYADERVRAPVVHAQNDNAEYLREADVESRRFTCIDDLITFIRTDGVNIITLLSRFEWLSICLCRGHSHLGRKNCKKRL